MEFLADRALWVTKYLRPDRAGALRRDDARNLLRRTLHLYAGQHGLRVHAWACLPSRVDLVLGLPIDSPVQEAMADVFGYYTRRFNTRYRQSGPLLRTKFLRRLLIGPAAIREAVMTVSRLPAEQLLRRRPGQEAWSSAAFYEGGELDPLVTPYVVGSSTAPPSAPPPEGRGVMQGPPFATISGRASDITGA